MSTKYIHIGNLIREKLKEMHLKPADLARKISYSLPGTTRFLQHESMQTKVLLKICRALEYDFFRHYSDIPNEEEVNRLQGDTGRLEKELEESREKVGALQNEVEYLKKIVALHEKKGD